MLENRILLSITASILASEKIGVNILGTMGTDFPTPQVFGQEPKLF